jgi:DNA-directed RNA polymerase specialized sigma24 family protein
MKNPTVLPQQEETRKAEPWRREPAPEMCLYRMTTLAMLRRYFRASLEMGRLPSMIGREFFRTRVTSYKMHSLEDVVIFVHDMEKCLQKLDSFRQALIAKIVFQDYDQEQTARLLGCTRRTVVREFPGALDRCSEILLEVGLLQEESERRHKKICQAAGSVEKAVSA